MTMHYVCQSTLKHQKVFTFARLIPRFSHFRYRRSPSVASEISSLLEPIPEEEPNRDVIRSDVIVHNSQKMELIRQSKAAARYWTKVGVLTTHRLAYLCRKCFASLDLKLAPKWK